MSSRSLYSTPKISSGSNVRIKLADNTTDLKIFVGDTELLGAVDLTIRADPTEFGVFAHIKVLLAAEPKENKVVAKYSPPKKNPKWTWVKD